MKKYRIICLLMCFIMVFALCACENENNVPDITFEGKYVLLSATKDGKYCTDEFEQYTLDITNGFLNVMISHNEITTMRNNSTFTIKGDTVTEKSSFTSDTFIYKGTDTELKTTFDGYEITLIRFDPNSVINAPVDFESVLFGADINDVKIFNYCPAILMENDENGKEVMNIWYCTNKDDGVIMDHIGYRTGVKQANGKWVFSNEQIVLAPTTGT